MRPDLAGARVCVLTPQGRGAVAVVRVWGPDAVSVADAAFRPRSGPGLAGRAAGRARARAGVAVGGVGGRAAGAGAGAAFRPRSGPGLAGTAAGRLRLGRMGAGL